MIILIGSQKGGCGKSTISVNIAVEMMNQGKDVVLVDADRQSTSSNWVLDRDTNDGTKNIPSVQKYENIRSTLEELNHRYEVVIVDCAGRDSKEFRTGVTIADLLITPFKASQPDLDTLPHLVEKIISPARDFNESLKCYALLTMLPTNPTISEKQEAEDYFYDFKEYFTLMKSSICERKVYRDCMSEGLGVVEMANVKAKKEIIDLTNEILKDA